MSKRFNGQLARRVHNSMAVDFSKRVCYYDVYYIYLLLLLLFLMGSPYLPSFARHEMVAFEEKTYGRYLFVVK